MVMTGVVTTVAAINTSEVIFQIDTELSDVITTVGLTGDGAYDKQLADHYYAKYHQGYFGTPKTIKFPESTVRYAVAPARLSGDEWKATKGWAHLFLTNEPIQKVYGGALIYMRSNTPTTQHIGTIISGDMIDVVTTDGWQLGYRVESTASDPAELSPPLRADSRLVIVLIDDKTGNRQSVAATLFKVGERI